MKKEYYIDYPQEKIDLGLIYIDVQYVKKSHYLSMDYYINMMLIVVIG